MTRRPMLAGLTVLFGAAVSCFVASVVALMWGQWAFDRGDEAQASGLVLASMAAQRIASVLLAGGLVYLVVLASVRRLTKPHASGV